MCFYFQGQHSLEESISRRVPMLIIPFQSDQVANAIRAEERQIAKILNINTKINSNDVKNSILAVVNDERWQNEKLILVKKIHEYSNFSSFSFSYKANIERLAKLVEDSPMTSRERAVWHVEYVLRNGGAKFLRYDQKTIPFYQYHYYDVIGAVVTVLLVIFVVISKCLKMCRKKFMKNKVKKE